MTLLTIGFTLGLILFYLKFYTARKVTEAERKYPPLGKFVTVDGIRLHYVSKGEGRPVVFIHGSFGSAYDFTLSILDRAAEKYRAIAFDRPGHGYSQRPSHMSMSLFDHARYIRGAVKALGLEPPILVGHSIGGAVALAYALDYAEDAAGVVLLSGYVTPFKGPCNPIHSIPAIPLIGKVYLAALVRPLGNRIKQAIAKKVFSPYEPPQAYIDAAAALAMRPLHFAANAEDIRNLCDGLRIINTSYGRIDLPLTILTGDADLIAPRANHADKIMAAVPQARVTVLPGTGHQPAFTHPDQVLKAIDHMAQLSQTG
ncbi:MAG: alpha/beta hydrolase [Candidatus Omnitrophota bacterium]|nr:alpha/beta hydrolase [Candidatus Omnitrophota bacterium]